MSYSPNYRFNKNPQFSVNHISDYLATSNATQRTRVIRAAKFPKKVEVASYSQIRNTLRKALVKPDFARDDLDFLADRLETKAVVETGWQRAEALRCAQAVRAFQETFNPKTFSRYTISPSTKTISRAINGVKLNVTLDATITQTTKEVTNSGGIVLKYAFGADRSSVKSELAAASGLILWALDGGQMQPLSRLCMAVDLADHNVVKASKSFERFRERVTDSCGEISARWGDVEPPHDYDGPNWD